MLDERTKSALEMYALGAICEADVEYLLNKPFSTLSEEEKQYIEVTQKDYDEWLIEQQIKDYSIQIVNVCINPVIINKLIINAQNPD